MHKGKILVSLCREVQRKITIDDYMRGYHGNVLHKSHLSRSTVAVSIWWSRRHWLLIENRGNRLMQL